MKRKGIFLIAIFSILTFLINSCGNTTNNEKKCVPKIQLAGYSGNEIKIEAGKITTFEAKVDTCGKDVGGLTYGWYLDGAETPVSSTNKYDYIACNKDAGTHSLKIIATSVSSSFTISNTFTINVVKVANPKRPSCYYSAMQTITTGYVQAFTAAVNCLDSYLKTYVCDIDANFAAGLGKEVLFLMSIEDLYKKHTQLTSKDIEDIGNKIIIPMTNNFKVVLEKAKKNWTFYEEGLTDVVISDGNARYFDPLDIRLWGEFDLGDIYFLVSQAKAMEGWYYMATAFKGFIDHFLKIPFDFSIKSEIQRFVNHMIDDPTFLTFAGKDGKEGKENLLLARGAFIDSVHLMQQMFTEIKEEIDDQSDDHIRYWDCGADAICPPASECKGGASWIDPINGDPPEYKLKGNPPKFVQNNYNSCEEAGDDYDDINHNGKCDEGWQKVGPDQDGTECNNKYDDGEPLGTDIFGFPDFRVINVAADLSRILIALNEVELSLIGPDHPLDYDRMIGQPEGTVHRFFNMIGLPYPEIRLSEAFLTPTEARLIVPLYSISKRFFIIDDEYEPFEDVGYDGCEDKYEDGKGGCVNDPKLSPYDPVKNPDPNHDNLDLSCAPECNQNDGYDNDGDGRIDEENSSTIMGNVPGDLGAEGNLVFDFVDTNGNYKHDPNEKHEPFDDVGITGLPGSANNDKWDTKDLPHTWPNGPDVGPVNDISMTDPRDGTDYEKSQDNPDGELIDFYYLFFPDPTFSNFLTFPDEIKNADGEVLNDHAKLHRFISKIFDLMQKTNTYDNGVHETQ